VADTHIFGKAATLSEPGTSRLVKKCHFYLSHLHLVPPLAVMPSEFQIEDLLHCKTRVSRQSCGTVLEILHLAILAEHQLDHWTNGQTCDDSK